MFDFKNVFSRNCEHTDAIPSPTRGEGRISKRGTSFRNSGEGYNLQAHRYHELLPTPSLPNKGGSKELHSNVNKSLAAWLPSCTLQVSVILNLFQDLDETLKQVQGDVRRKLVKLCAFTLAEVLITLGIIGVVTAITMPTLIQKQNDKAAVSALKKTYSALSQAFLLAINENGSPETWGFSSKNSEKLLTTMLPYLKVTKVCSVGEKCHPADYIFYKSGLKIGNFIFNPSTSDVSRRAAQLADGTIIATYTHRGDCSLVFVSSNKYLNSVCGEFMVDINGGKRPNKYGDDIFIFNVTKYGLIPTGSAIYSQSISNFTFEKGCLSKNATGWGCAGWVLENENRDYRYCTDLSWSGKSKCK